MTRDTTNIKYHFSKKKIKKQLIVIFFILNLLVSIQIFMYSSYTQVCLYTSIHAIQCPKIAELSIK